MKIVIIFLALVLSSCSSLQKIPSLSENAGIPNIYPNYSTENKIQYLITNDENNLHIRFNTSDRSSITKILRGGLTVYIDASGGKSQDIFVQYPIAHSDASSRQSMRNTSDGERGEFDLNSIVSQVPEKAIISVNKANESIHPAMNNLGIRVSVSVSNTNELNYDLLIPFSKISNNGISSLADLSIGIVTGKIEFPQMNRERNEGDYAGSGRGGGNRDGIGGGGGRHGGGKSGNGIDRTSLNTPVDIWFKLDLYHSK